MIEKMPFPDFVMAMKILARRTKSSELTSEQIKAYWGSLKYISHKRLKWTLEAAARQCKWFPTTGQIWSISKDYHAPAKTPNIVIKEGISLKEALKDSDNKKAWDNLSQEMRQIIEKL